MGEAIPKVVDFFLCLGVGPSEDYLDAFNIARPIYKVRQLPLSFDAVCFVVQFSDYPSLASLRFGFYLRRADSSKVIVEGQFPAGYNKLSVIVQAPKFVIPLEGEYRIDFEIEGTVIASRPIRVIHSR